MKYILICMVILTSCTPQKRLQRLLDKHPDLIHRLDTTIHDTIIHTDTITIKGDSINTSVFLDSLSTMFQNIYSDSIYSLSMAKVDGKIKTKLIVKDRVVTKTDTLIKEITVPAKVVTIERAWQDDWWFYAFCIMTLMTILTLWIKR